MPLPPPARGPRGPARVKSQDPLRESVLELFARSFQRAEKKERGSGFKVYRWASSMYYRLCAEPWAHTTIFPSTTDLTKKFVAETGLQVTNVHAFVQHALMANSWASTWTAPILELKKDQFRLYVKGIGLENLRAAMTAGRGVILAHAHTVFSQIAWRLFEHEGIPEGMTLWQWTWDRPREQLEDPKIRAMEGAKEIFLATRALREGGIVHVLADGKRGGDKLAVNFFNRRRVFQPTFAELVYGLPSPCAVLPVDVVLSIDGQILVEIGAPLDTAGENADRNARVEKLVRCYVDHHTRRWNSHASNLPWGQMMRHLDAPRWEAH